MKAMRILGSILLALIALPERFAAQVLDPEERNVQPAPEIRRLFEAFAGDWDTSEKRERTRFFPDGGERKGRSHVRLAGGGAMLVMEGHSDGSAGPLSYLIVIWWDKDAKIYRYFTCFKSLDSGCEVRGTARWNANTFVTTKKVDGQELKFRDTF